MNDDHPFFRRSSGDVWQARNRDRLAVLERLDTHNALNDYVVIKPLSRVVKVRGMKTTPHRTRVE